MTDRYGVVGNPISQSKSPLIHRAFARATGQQLEYRAIEAPLGGFAAVADAFRASGGRGLNVTAPFKMDAFVFAAHLSDRALRAGAVNALKFTGLTVEGENFDGLGLVRDIVVNAACPIAGKRVLLLGAGGAARGALLPLLAERPAQLRLVNRDADKARALAASMADAGAICAGGYDDIGPAGFDLVINATSASLTGALPATPAVAFRGCLLAYDLTYGKGLTPFLAAARAGGAARIADGVGMLVEQAAEAFAWWRGVRPPTDAVMAALTVPLVAPR